LNFKKSRRFQVPNSPPGWTVWCCQHKWYLKNNPKTKIVANLIKVYRCRECGAEWIESSTGPSTRPSNKNGGFHIRPGWVEKLTHGI